MKKRGIIGLAIAAASFSQGNAEARQPTEDEIKAFVAKIFETCTTEVLGHPQAEGEHVTGAQGAAITDCVGKLVAAYREGLKNSQ
jgi:hypothetical protein